MPACISAAIRVTVAFPVPTGRAVCRMPVPAARKPVQHPLARPRALVGLDRSSKLCRSVPRTFFDTIYTTYIGTVNALTNLVGTRQKGTGVQQNSIAKRLPRRGLESASPTV